MTVPRKAAPKPATDTPKEHPVTTTATTTGTTDTPTPNVCLCGCAEVVKSKRGTYRPGHDARHAGEVARQVAADGDTGRYEALPTEALRSKAAGLTARLLAKAEAQATRAATAEAKAAK